jgi:hypothetical protein
MECEMARDEIDRQYRDDIDLLVEESDEALEGACGGLMRGFSTLAYGSYCFTCRLHLHSGKLWTRWSSDRETCGGGYER